VESRIASLAARSALAINLDLSHGRHGASARVEFHDGEEGTCARVVVRGWIESVGFRRLRDILEDLARRGVVRLVLDCSELREIEGRCLAELIESLASLRSPAFDYQVCGLTPRLRERFRWAGFDPSILDAPRDRAPLPTPDDESPRELAS
jgi:hypothetical protein